MGTTVELLTEQESAVYDRQIRVWGVDAQRRLGKARVLAVGITGVVAETCKNIVLAGVGALTLLDEAPVTLAAAQSNFLIPWEELERSGQTIGAVCADSLKDFNPMVKVSVVTGDIAEKPDEFWDSYDAVVLGRGTLDLRIRVNSVCRQRPNKVAFYWVECRGSCGTIFVDLLRHSYVPKKEGDSVDAISEIVFPSLLDSLSVQWKSLPKRTSKLFFAMRVIEEFEQGRANEPSHNEVADIQTLSKMLCKAQGVSESLVPEALLRRILNAGTRELPPVCAILGGILGQEILRAMSGKGEPLRNFFFFDAHDGKGVIEGILPAV